MIQIDDEKISEEEKARAEARPVIEVDPKQEYPLTEEDKMDIVRHAEYTFVFGSNEIKDEMPEEKKKMDDYVSVKVPFSGMYESYWEESLDREQENFLDDMCVDQYSESAETIIRYNLEDLEKSPAWKEQAAMVLSDDVKEYRCGKKRFEFEVPCGYKEVLNANLHAIDEALDHTILQSAFNAHNWKVSSFSLSDDYGRWNDVLEYWIPRGIFPLMGIPEVFKCKWYQKYVKWFSHSRSGYMSLSSESQFYNPANWRYYEAVLKFWIAVGLYAERHRIRPVYPTEFDKMEDSDIFNDETGLGKEIGLRLEEMGIEDFYPQYDLTKAYI